MSLRFLVSTYCAITGVFIALAVQDEDLHVQCGMENMQVVIPRHIKHNAKLKVLHKSGKMDLLQTDTSCSLWVTQKPDGSVIVGTAYEGCYVTQTDRDFVMTLGFPTKQDGRKKVILRKELKCSMESYDDAPSSDQCAAVSKPDRLSCPSLQDSCTSIGCCYDPSDQTTPCYYGNTVTASCTPDGLFSIAVASALTAPMLDLNSVHLLGSGAECDPVARNDAFLLYTFPLSSCGTTLKVVGDQAMYENELLATDTVQIWKGISITRETTFRLLIRCSFAVTGFLPLKVQVITLPPPPPLFSEGPMKFDMRIGVDSQYSNYYEDRDYPVVKVLQDPVYAEVRLLGKSDSYLSLVLHQCWATPTTDPLYEIQWPILVNGCPFPGDNYISELMPIDGTSTIMFPTHYSRFSLKTFIFVDKNTGQPLGGQVYIHCSVSACMPSLEETCTSTCSRRKRSNILMDNSKTVLVSLNIPVYFEGFLQNMQKDPKAYGVQRLSLPQDQINIALVTLGMLGVLLLTLSTWAFNRQRKSRSLLISKPSSEKKTPMHIRSVSSNVMK
ncbi:zona pellucida sperm-binding protein 4-like isoform X1 [Rana temporaria]|uniref:zona pellucida sperm-binding protein 4-like isoform X1 n=1 Tax=Rana temporaria TaxID=8407 RepID=UPI001AAE0A5B|nr:zona pellucida sperm-binding protein 4-like isoform X1 [Rana temporaria]